MNQSLRNKVAKCKTVNEVLDLAKANNYDITSSQAEKVFNETRNNATKLSDEDLNNVAGGSSCGNCTAGYEFVKFSSEAEVSYIVEIGQKVKVFNDLSNNTSERVVDDRKAACLHDSDGKEFWCDEYHFKGDSVCVWKSRTSIEKSQ